MVIPQIGACHQVDPDIIILRHPLRIPPAEPPLLFQLNSAIHPHPKKPTQILPAATYKHNPARFHITVRISRPWVVMPAVVSPVHSDPPMDLSNQVTPCGKDR